MFRYLAIAFVGLTCAAVCADVITRADLSYWMDDFAEVGDWDARADWLADADPSAGVTSDGTVACFVVATPGRGMKWLRTIVPVALAEAPYLIFRYRAEGLRTDSADYLVYLDTNEAGKECHAIRLCDAVADGQWRTVAVDVRGVTAGDFVDEVALQVQAGQSGAARLWIDEMGFAESVPEHAELLRAEGPAVEAPDAAVDLSEATWRAQPSWLGNPADGVSVHRDEAAAAWTFRVTGGARGMKWSHSFADPVTLEGHAILALRYRAHNLARYHDYALSFLGETADGSAYEEIVRGVDLEADGRWHTISVSIQQAGARIPQASGVAVQVQAAGRYGELSVGEMRLLARRPDSSLADEVALGLGFDESGFACVDLGGVVNQSLDPVLEALRLKDWPEADTITAESVPFRLVGGTPSLAATGVGAVGDLTIPIDRPATQVFVLMLAVLHGQDEEVYGGGPFRRIDEVDRFLLRLDYTDGRVEECFPGNVSTGRFEMTNGAQVLCAHADGVLESVTILDRTEQGAFAVAGVTCRTEGEALFTELDEAAPPIVAKRWTGAPEPGVGRIVEHPDGRIMVENGLLRVGIASDPRQGIVEFYDKVAGHSLTASDAHWPLFEWQGGEKEAAGGAAMVEKRGDGALEMTFALPLCPGVQLRVAMDFTEAGALRFRGRLVNAGDTPQRVGVTFPKVGPYVLGDDAADDGYVFPSRAAYVGADAINVEARYGGLFGAQFMATADAAAGQGLYLRTEDAACIQRYYALRKDEAGLTLAVRYPERSLAPGEERPLADTIVAITDGDWHGALDDYRQWLATWYRPMVPRKPWFREAFNFRQRFLHWLDPLYDGETGVIDLGRAVEECRAEFGGIDYLHLFDWGNCGAHGRIYGRIGDYSPYDFIKGGQQNLHDAIAAIREQGVPVGLYIEGYLLNEAGLLGQAHGEAWQLRRADGSGARWPNSQEIYACAGVEAWRDVQAATYAAKVGELDVDGMYIDQYGFTGTDKDCYSDAHGHPAPSDPVATEQATTRAIRAAIEGVKPGVAIYTEESPCDVTTQYQDGAFTYEMNQLHARRAEVPINLFRFAVPDFKTFEILICDGPTGSWATGVYWTFFNGEGIWIEGEASKWFSADTRAAIRRCHAVLREHRDAFTSGDVEPLVATAAGGILANHFAVDGKEVWTLYNTRHRTYDGPVLRVPSRSGWRWHDAWNGAVPRVDVNDGADTISTTIAPHRVGCLVRER
ncbi:MAG TPA: DUF6259 domain-containing protein [Candidatus Hydrogenedentes bacterium]|mgnify:CR=1 FL=1|nr:DUF6259 domain-containing protein [Candidatus Hydrogenedentota bacterium]HPG65807.1 DUF6259 domain-containing protein [Candidatus Hydrogenedentota bacterium]